MIDPTGGGIGKTAGRLLQQVQQNARELRGPGPGSPAGGSGQSFQSTLEATRRAHAPVGPAALQGAAPAAPAAVQGSMTAGSARAVLARARVQSGTAPARVGESAAAQRSRMAQMVDQLLGSQDKMTEIIKLALSGKQFTSQELLAMQAGVYRFAQELDLTGKVIEKATSGIKQTMNTQV